MDFSPYSLKEQSHKSYRPLCVLTFRWNYAMHGLEPLGFHLVNMLLHILVSIMYFRYVRQKSFSTKLLNKCLEQIYRPGEAKKLWKLLTSADCSWAAELKLVLLQHVHNNTPRPDSLHCSSAVCSSPHPYWSCEYCAVPFAPIGICIILHNVQFNSSDFKELKIKFSDAMEKYFIFSIHPTRSISPTREKTCWEC